MSSEGSVPANRFNGHNESPDSEARRQTDAPSLRLEVSCRGKVRHPENTEVAAGDIQNGTSVSSLDGASINLAGTSQGRREIAATNSGASQVEAAPLPATGVLEQKEQVFRPEVRYHSPVSAEETGPDSLETGCSTRLHVPSFLFGEWIALEKGYAASGTRRADAALGSTAASKFEELVSATLADERRLLEHSADAFEQRRAADVGTAGSNQLYEEGSLRAQVAALHSRLALVEASQQQHRGCAQLQLARQQSGRVALSSLVSRTGAIFWKQLGQLDSMISYLARRILLDNSSTGDDRGVGHGDSSGGGAVLSGKGGAAARGWESATWRIRSLLGACLMVLAVEGGFRVARLGRRRLPPKMMTLTSPVDYGLKLARLAVWTSVFIVGAQELKRSCFRAADACLGLRPRNGPGEPSSTS